MSGESQPPVRAVSRAVDILDCLVNGPMPLREIADSTQLTKATCHRLLATLSHRRMVVQDPVSSNYLLGPGILRLLHAFVNSHRSFGVLARPQMEQLAAEVGETVTLHLRVGGYRVCVEEVASLNPLRYVSGVGEFVPIHVGSAGKILLAFLDESQLLALISTARRTSPSAGSSLGTGFRRELSSIREVGWAVSKGERIEGAAAVSVPVSSDGEVVAALSVLGPHDRVLPRVDMMAACLARTAKHIDHLIEAASRENTE